MARNRRSSTRTIIVASVMAGAAALVGATMLPASADTTVSATGADASDAASKAFALCQQQGYNADTIVDQRTNPDGTVTLTMHCYNV
jgi:hypothetical protein